MATFIQAVSKYGPRLQRRPKVELKELAIRLSDVTGMRKSEVIAVLLELQSAIEHYVRQGAPVELPNIGTFTPSLRTDGRIVVLYRADIELRKELGSVARHDGQVLNRENIGLEPEDYKALWDAEHPDDLLELPPRLLPDPGEGGEGGEGGTVVVRKAKARTRWW